MQLKLILEFANMHEMCKNMRFLNVFLLGCIINLYLTTETTFCLLYVWC